MIINRVKLNNFMHFSEVDLEVGEGIFFISGENRDQLTSDSNGSGKSALCQSIVWCLFDDLIRKGLLKDGVIGSERSWASVYVSVSKGDSHIEVTRFRKHPDYGNEVRVLLNGIDVTKHKVEDTNLLIESLLDLKSKIIYYCAYNDDDKPPFVSLSPSVMSKVISEILDTGRFDTYIKEIRSSIKDKGKYIDNSLPLVESKIQYKSSYTLELENIQSQIDEFDSEKVKKISEIKSKVSNIKSDIESYKSMTSGKLSIESALKDLSPSLEKLEVIRGELLTFRRKSDELSKKLSGVNNRFYKAEAELKSIQQSYDNIFNNMTGECMYCGNILHSSKKLDFKVSDISSKKDKAEAEMTIAEVDRDNLSEQIKELNLAIKKLNDQEAELRESTLSYSKLKEQLNEIEGVEQALKYLYQKLSDFLEEIEVVQKSEPSALFKNLSFKKDQISKIDLEIQEALKNIETSKSELFSLECLLKAVVSTKAQIFNNFIINLQDRINKNLEAISEGDYFCTLENKGEELLLNFSKGDSGESMSYHAFSKGEKTRISKAVSVSLNDIMNVGFYIDDEGLPGLDKSGVKYILDFVISITEAKTLLFVSHDEAVRDYFKGHCNIHVIKESGLGRVEVR
jgi:DNA repair exonuclease SbcCD ATPase subunit